MSRAHQFGKWMALVAFAASYSALAHYTNTAGNAGNLGALVALAPILLAAFSLAWHAKHKKLAITLFATGCAILASAWGALTDHFAWLYWAEHAGTQLLLLVIFARSLGTGHEPLCTRFARLVHGALPPRIEQYTRQVTLAWAIFFAAMVAMSTVIFTLAPLATWSVFSNFFTAPLIASMFIAEYLVRRRLHPQMKHAHILDGIKAYWNAPAG